MTDGERLGEIVETAVARGDAPGVVAAAAVPRTGLGMPAVCEDILRAARAAG